MTDTKHYVIPDLVALSDLPELFGVSRQWVDTMRWKKILPEPDLVLGRTPGWIKADIVKWWDENPIRRKRA